MRPKRSSAWLMIRSVVAGSDTSPSTVSTSGSAAGLDRPGGGHDRPALLPVRGDQAGPDALGPPVMMATFWSCWLMPCFLSPPVPRPLPRSAAGQSRVAGVRGERRGLLSHPGIQRQRRQDGLHPGLVLGAPQAQRAPLARQRPQPRQMPLPGQFPGSLRLPRLGVLDRLAGCARRDGAVNVTRNSRCPSPAAEPGCPGPGAGSFGCGARGVTSSVRHTRSGIDVSTSSSCRRPPPRTARASATRRAAAAAATAAARAAAPRVRACGRPRGRGCRPRLFRVFPPGHAWSW